MPVPLIVLAYAVPAALAAGAAAWEWLRPGKDPEWDDKTVFNDRMRQVQSGIQNLNDAFAQCKGFMSNSGELSAWRTFKNNWTKYYADVGKLDYLGPSSAQIANAKQYASQLVHWVDVLKSHKECVELAPNTPTAPPNLPPSEGDLPSWVAPAAIGAALALYAMSQGKPARANPRRRLRKRYYVYR